MTKISSLIGREETLGANQLESLLPGLRFEIALHRGRRVTVDAHQLESQGCVFVETLERRCAMTETLPLHDHPWPACPLLSPWFVAHAMPAYQPLPERQQSLKTRLLPFVSRLTETAIAINPRPDDLRKEMRPPPVQLDEAPDPVKFLETAEDAPGLPKVNIFPME